MVRLEPVRRWYEQQMDHRCCFFLLPVPVNPRARHFRSATQRPPQSEGSQFKLDGTSGTKLDGTDVVLISHVVFRYG